MWWFLSSWFIGQPGQKISCTKTQTLPNLRLPVSSDEVTERVADRKEVSHVVRETRHFAIIGWIFPGSLWHEGGVRVSGGRGHFLRWTCFLQFRTKICNFVQKGNLYVWSFTKLPFCLLHDWFVLQNKTFTSLPSKKITSELSSSSSSVVVVVVVFSAVRCES